MARKVTIQEKGPMEIKVGGESKWICMCGLTANKPFCDGKHKQCHSEEDGKTYEYKDGTRTEIAK